MNKVSFSNQLRILVYVLPALLILTGLTTLNSYNSDSTASSAQNRTKKDEFGELRIKVFNETSSFELINNEIVGNNMELTLKNNYDKSIDTFYLTVGSGTVTDTYTVQLLFSDFRSKISPQQTFTMNVSLDKKLYSEGLFIKAVLFTDGTGDGNEIDIKEMTDIRQGEIFQLEKGLELLKNSLSLQFGGDSKLIDLNSRFSSLSLKDPTKSPAYNSGLQNGRDILINNLYDIQKNKNFDVLTAEEKILKLQLKLEKFTAKGASRYE